jgi:hypothetical protein
VSKFAILSEDETAYGNIAAKQQAESTAERPEDFICPKATWIYYPRDISTLRAAYQSQSMFSTATTQQSQDSAQRKSLPTDLADPGGEQHDTVRTYAGNQTPLSQEAQLLGIVEALRARHTQYVIVRSSNTLDPLFLANFLRRDLPEARVVVLNSDLLFQRGKDAMALSGVMTLSTYPLFSSARSGPRCGGGGALAPGVSRKHDGRELHCVAAFAAVFSARHESEAAAQLRNHWRRRCKAGSIRATSAMRSGVRVQEGEPRVRAAT